MLDLRPQRQWAVKADNTMLESHLPTETETKLAALLGSFRESLAETMQYMAEVCQSRTYCCQLPVIVDTEDDFTRLLEKLQKQRFIGVRVFNEELRSYKGFCTWVGMHSSHGIYLIDLVKLRRKGSELKILFEDVRLMKLGIAFERQLQWLQRDFSIFSVNCFDIKELLAAAELPADISCLSEKLFNRTIERPEKPELMYCRPLASEQKEYLSDCTALTTRIIATHPKYFFDQPTEALERAYYNSNFHCRHAYRHRTETVGDLEAVIFVGKENMIFRTDDSLWKLKKLTKWREHTAKMRDESVEYILPTKILKQIILREVKSMLELRNIYSDYEEKDVDRDSMSQIIEILLEKKKTFDPEKIRQEVESHLNEPEVLFRQTGWMDKDWRSNDYESQKLYKEIISMKELEPSIIEPELASTKPKTLSNGQLMCLFQYAKHWDDPSLLKMHYRDFKENKFENEEHPNSQSEKQEEQRNFRDRFPESIREIYELANRKKREMKKEKKRSTAEEKEETFNLNVRDFLRTIGWA